MSRGDGGAGGLGGLGGGGGGGGGGGRCALLCAGFNQDNSCFLGGTPNGFFTFNTEPFSEGTRRTFENGGVGSVELLYRSNILALVGGGSCPQWPVNKVMLWDDSKRKCVGELSFHTAVKAVRMRRDLVVVALERKCYVYNFVDLQVLHSFETFANPRGLLALSLEQEAPVLAYPAVEKGSFRMEHLCAEGLEKTVEVCAHESELGALALNRAGTAVASASERGTLIRVFATSDGQLTHLLRRGADRAVIMSLCFNASSTLLACTSDKYTAHVFSVEGEGVGGADAEEGAAPPQRQLSDLLPSNLVSMAEQAQGALKHRVGPLLPKYFTTETRRSVVRFPVQETATVCAFGAKSNTLLVGGMDGTFSHHAFDPATGAHERTFFGSV